MSERNTKDALWYVVHTYSGYENKVKTTLEMIVENRGLQDYIQEIVIPTEEVVEIKEGERKVKDRKLYPGYLLIKLILTDQIWYIIRNTHGVTGFVGASSTNPTPLTEEELIVMGLVENKEPIVDYKLGDSVKIISGPLDGFVGTVEEIDGEKKKLIVLVSMFGRETPVELELTQVLRV